MSNRLIWIVLLVVVLAGLLFFMFGGRTGTQEAGEGATPPHAIVTE